MKDSVRDFLRSAVLKRETVDLFLKPRAACWARHDPVLGYTYRNALIRDGMDGAHTVCTYAPTGERRMLAFADRPCRINTYGNSFTQGVQVSDGETWQETLAAHFGEPIRNFGVGGYGVYQAYLRMVRVETTPGLGAPYVILNLWGDDHHRSLMAWRWLACFEHWSQAAADETFHFPTWAHVRIDPATGGLVERPNPCPSPESLYRLCDARQVVEMFEDDVVVRMQVAQRKGAALDVAPLEELARALELDLDFRSPDALPASAQALINACAWRATMLLAEKAQAFCREHGKQLLVLLSYPEGEVAAACGGADRDAPGFMDWHPLALRRHLAEKGIRTVDSLPKHVADYAAFRPDPAAYVKRYYIGHYNPLGNHFFAFAIKDDLLAWLDPKPPTYQPGGDIVRFQGYLPE